jgi:HAD superfamily hydrolase (TIGR01549 family)
MKLDTVLFDLDGTLLPMDQDHFVKLYFGALASYGFKERGLDPKMLTNGIWAGTKAMLRNDGQATNRVRFWECFCSLLDGTDMETLEPVFERFYETEFKAARDAVSASDTAQKSICLLRKKGYTLALATNPVFPLVAVKKRLAWAGIPYTDFTHITTYDNSSYCKPNAAYFTDILAHLSKSPENCLMVGNDVYDDMGAKAAGLDVYLVTDCVINEQNLPTDGFRQGNMEAFYTYVKELPEVAL